MQSPGNETEKMLSIRMKKSSEILIYNILAFNKAYNTNTETNGFNMKLFELFTLQINAIIDALGEIDLNQEEQTELGDIVNVHDPEESKLSEILHRTIFPTTIDKYKKIYPMAYKFMLSIANLGVFTYPHQYIPDIDLFYRYYDTYGTGFADYIIRHFIMPDSKGNLVVWNGYNPSDINDINNISREFFGYVPFNALPLGTFKSHKVITAANPNISIVLSWDDGSGKIVILTFLHMKGKPPLFIIMGAFGTGSTRYLNATKHGEESNLIHEESILNVMKSKLLGLLDKRHTGMIESDVPYSIIILTVENLTIDFLLNWVTTVTIPEYRLKLLNITKDIPLNILFNDEALADRFEIPATLLHLVDFNRPSMWKLFDRSFNREYYIDPDIIQNIEREIDDYILYMALVIRSHVTYSKKKGHDIVDPKFVKTVVDSFKYGTASQLYYDLRVRQVIGGTIDDEFSYSPESISEDISKKTGSEKNIASVENLNDFLTGYNQHDDTLPYANFMKYQKPWFLFTSGSKFDKNSRSYNLVKNQDAIYGFDEFYDIPKILGTKIGQSNKKKNKKHDLRIMDLNDNKEFTYMKQNLKNYLVYKIQPQSERKPDIEKMFLHARKLIRLCMKNHSVSSFDDRTMFYARMCCLLLNDPLMILAEFASISYQHTRLSPSNGMSDNAFFLAKPYTGHAKKFSTSGKAAGNEGETKFADFIIEWPGVSALDFSGKSKTPYQLPEWPEIETRLPLRKKK